LRDGDDRATELVAGLHTTVREIDDDDDHTLLLGAADLVEREQAITCAPGKRAHRSA